MRACKPCRMRIRALTEAPTARRNPTRWFTGLPGVPTSLLEGNSAKTSLGEELGYMTAVLYLLPHDQLAEFMEMGKRGEVPNVCCSASAGCALGCLVDTGQGGSDSAMLAKARKTWLFHFDTAWFMRQLQIDISKLVNSAARTQARDLVTGQLRPMIPCVRLNGTSDIRWEKPQGGVKITEVFPQVQFYDYTKWAFKARSPGPNYELTYSYSDNDRSPREAQVWLENGKNVAVVWRTLEDVIDVVQIGKWRSPAWSKAYPAIDGDRDDLRFLDPHPAVVALYAKRDVGERYTEDPFGFFLERIPQAAASQGWAPPPEHAIDTYRTSVAPAAWKARVAGFEEAMVLDRRSGRTRKVMAAVPGSMPTRNRQGNAAMVGEQKKAWAKAYFGSYARQLSPQGKKKQAELLAQLGPAASVRGVGHSGMAASAAQLASSGLTPKGIALRTWDQYYSQGRVRPEYRAVFLNAKKVRNSKSAGVKAGTRKIAEDILHATVGFSMLADYDIDIVPGESPLVTFGRTVAERITMAAETGEALAKPNRRRPLPFVVPMPKLKTPAQYAAIERKRKAAARKKRS